MADTPSTSLCPVCQQERARKQWSPAQWTHWDPWRTGRSCCVLCEDSPKTWLTSMPPRITQEDYAALRQRWREDGGGSQPSCHLQRSRSRSGSDRRGTSAPRLPGTRRSRSRSRGARRRTSATRLSTSSQLADSKYRDQLIHAYQFLQEAIGSVIKLDELMSRPGSEPLRALLEGPHAQQLQDVENARTALEIVTLLCCEEGVEVTAQTATAEGRVGGIAVRGHMGSQVGTSAGAIEPAPASGADEEKTACLVCGREDAFLPAVGPLMLCGPEGHPCRGAMHKKCAKISAFPRGYWWCPRCRDARARVYVPAQGPAPASGADE